jgi:hypothetical protein
MKLVSPTYLFDFASLLTPPLATVFASIPATYPVYQLPLYTTFSFDPSAYGLLISCFS